MQWYRFEQCLENWDGPATATRRGAGAESIGWWWSVGCSILSAIAFLMHWPSPLAEPAGHVRPSGTGSVSRCRSFLHPCWRYLKRLFNSCGVVVTSCLRAAITNYLPCGANRLLWRRIEPPFWRREGHQLFAVPGVHPCFAITWNWKQIEEIRYTYILERVQHKLVMINWI